MNEDNLFGWTKHAQAHLCARTDTVFFPQSEVSGRAVSLTDGILIPLLVPKLCNFTGLGRFCPGVRLHRGGSATNGATPSSLC